MSEAKKHKKMPEIQAFMDNSMTNCREAFCCLFILRQNGLKIRIVILFTGTFKEYYSKRNGLLS